MSTSESGEAPASGALGEVLDEHAELGEILQQIETGTDAAVLGGLLARLEAFCENHFSREEREGILARGALLDADVATECDALVEEHRGLLGAVRELAGRVGSGACSLAEARREAREIAHRLRGHDAREASLLRTCAGVEAGAPPDPKGFASSALDVNLRRTAVGVAIPPDQRVLLECTEHLAGVHQGMRALLREIYHRYVGWSQTLDELHRRAMGDLFHLLEHRRGPEAVGAFFRLYEKAVREAPSPELRETAVRRHLQYGLKVVEVGVRWPELRQSLARALEDLRSALEASPDLAFQASAGLRRLARALVDADGPEGAAGQAALSLLARVLEGVYARWIAGEDPEAWWRELAPASEPGALPESVAAVSRARLAAHRERLAELARAPAEARREILALPDHAHLARTCLAAAADLEPSEGEGWRARLVRIRWLLQVLAASHLHIVHEDALAEIQHASASVLREAPASSAAPVVREIFDSLRERGLSTSRPALSLVARLGEEALAARDPAWSEAFVDCVLDWDFAYPEFSGFSESWQLRANPSHIGAIRTFLALIEARPELAGPLVAALVVHLELGGVVIADTDLFQRDVSKLLASGVGPVFHPVKHLLRLFPVYFDEIGAEGELREVSTRIDEVDGRRDLLCHFLRKQSHVESNPEILGLIDAIGRYWATGEREPLRHYLPASLWDGLAATPRGELRALFAELAGDEPPEALFALDDETFEKRLAQAERGGAIEREKARLLYRLRRLVARKYELRHDDVLERIEASRRISATRLEPLREALARGEDEAALDGLLHVAEELHEIALRPGAVDAHEQIYRKRHIAVGIPSLYGSYREDRFDAMGLVLRVESLAGALFERMLAAEPLAWVTRSTLRRVLRWLHLLRRALWIDGCRARGLSTGIALFEQALAQEGFDLGRWQNVFQTLSRSVEQIVRIRFLDVYEPILDRILPRMLERGLLRVEADENPQEVVLKRSEAVLRGLLARSFGLQQLDGLVGRVLRALTRAREVLGPESAELLVGYDAERSFVDLDGERNPLDGMLHLGNKGYTLKRLMRFGLPVPPGFVLTTEVFRCRELFRACPDLDEELARKLRHHLERLEQRTGRRFGDPARPLLLSVRSTAAISMPGVLDTFLNVGINAEIAEGFGRRSGSAWAAWDAWRRFLQLWGMASGLQRYRFDALMREAKERHGVEKKAQFPPERMRELAFRYRELLHDHGVPPVEDPFSQLRDCIALVLRSWESAKAHLYRGEMQIAETWGTAVIVQSMVYGNLSQRSGTGALRTAAPRGRPGEVEIAGDFTVQGQGDDVVAGLVQTFPIGAAERPAPLCLERDFPAIHAALLRHARTLILELGMFHQEIEFTFESEREEDLYVLQTRDSVMASVTEIPAFLPAPTLDQARIATGIGAGGGALSGRVAHTMDDVNELSRRFPDDPILVLRPDTVPDDLPLLLRCSGMLTARGGGTSHAALVAQRLGRTCVVGCRQLEVYESEGRSLIGGHEVRMGDWLSINGIDGSVYLGRHPTTTVCRERLV